MPRFLIALALTACVEPDRDRCDDCDPPQTDGAGTDVGPTEEPETPPRTPVVTGPCAISPGLEVTSAVASPGRRANTAEIALNLTTSASAAALCTSDRDPGDRHLVESPEGKSHTLRLQGLMPDEPYTCAVAPTCPTMAPAPVEISFTTGSPPRGVPRLDVTVDPTLGMTGYWTLLPFQGGGGCGDEAFLVIYDADGEPRWWYRLPSGVDVDVEALHHPEDDTIVWGGGGGRDGAPRVLDLWSGEVYVSPSWPQSDYHHDGKRLADGRILSLESSDNWWGFYGWSGFVIRAHDPATGDVSVELDSQRYVSEGWLRIAGAFWDYDPYHANWIDLWSDPVGGDRVYASLCNDRSIMSFDAATGDVRWKLQAGVGWDTVDATGAPVPASFAIPQCQHGLEVIGDDVLLVYDNGQDRSFSQVTQLRVDPVARRVTVEWQWWEPGWKEDTFGDVDDLGGGRVLVTEGHPECWSGAEGDRSAIVEVDRATGLVASRLEFPSPEHATYRAERYDGCELFDDARACGTLADRALELGPMVGW